ncbi:MAG: lipopolysaccharide assembly protein LapA domain-containing protein [Halanaerobiales bacterium]|nr:lipopolysaccharide assembly protein LapA domain-containing protein [Halanaerobiales bacterium]
MQGTIIFGLIFAILIAIFAIQNASIVALNLLMWKFEISLAVVVLGSIIFGALVIGIFSYFKQFQLRRKNKNLKLEIQSLKDEIENKEEEINKLKTYERVSEENLEQEEEVEEKRGFFGRKKKKNSESEQDNEKNIAYNLEEDDSEEDTEKGN